MQGKRFCNKGNKKTAVVYLKRRVPQFLECVPVMYPLKSVWLSLSYQLK
jgi:hypothetical protein